MSLARKLALRVENDDYDECRIISKRQVQDQEPDNVLDDYAWLNPTRLRLKILSSSDRSVNNEDIQSQSNDGRNIQQKPKNWTVTSCGSSQSN